MRRTGITLIETLVAMFILMIGLVGVLAALPTGINSAQWVILQDCAIQLAHSKLSEFRRDRVNPMRDLAGGSLYLNARHGGPNTSTDGDWRNFLSGPGNPYQYFDDIARYEWRVDTNVVCAGVGSPPPPAGFLAPSSAGVAIGLARVTVVVRLKGGARDFRFTQYFAAYD